MSGLTVGSMFSGIGGLDLGLERAGMRVVWQAETDPYCARVLARHWPETPNLGDVTLIDWTEVPRVDVLCGGYPCQPFSVAGRRLGEHDPRHLWPHMLDAVRVLRPGWALLENVPGHLALGFGRVLGDLAEVGYDAEWDCIPAAAVGAHHRRDRVFIVAYPQRDHGGVRLADPYGSGWDGRPRVLRPGRRPQPAHGGGWPAEPDVGRVAHGVPSRLDRLRGLGNAVVPQVAEHIGRLITRGAA